LKVPVIVVFTKYDELVMQKRLESNPSGLESDTDKQLKSAKMLALKEFDQHCMKVIKKHVSKVPPVVNVSGM
jgi:hypothetical protein